MAAPIGIFASMLSAHLSSFESIATVTLGADVTSMTFSSIPATYKHLQLRILARGAAASANDQLYLRFNTDSANNYAWHYLKGDGASATAGAGSTISYARSSFVPAAYATANIWGVSIIDLLDYTNANKYKTLRSLGGADINGSGAVELVSAIWQSAATLTQIDIGCVGGNVKAGSTVALYGIKG